MGTTQLTSQAVRAQYERHPYPGHVPLVAIPAPAEELRFDSVTPGAPPTVLVAGCGTFEPLVVARSNPRGKIVAVDLSQRSLRRLRWRVLLARVVWALLPHRLLQQLLGRGLGSITPVQGDLNDRTLFAAERFDAIVCTGVLHHCADPGAVLENLARWLKPGGALRVMVYAPTSRRTIYDVQATFRAAGVSPERFSSHRALLVACRSVLRQLPFEERRRLSVAFEGYRDIHTFSGLVDGFFHAHDVAIPLDVLVSRAAQAGLVLSHLGRRTQEAIELDAPVEQQLVRLIGIDARQHLPVNPVLVFRRAEALAQAPALRRAA